MRRARALAQGTHGGPGVPPSRWVRPPAAIACALREAAWPERLRGAQSPHPRTHSPEHAQCGPGNFLPSRQRPRPAPGPQLAKLGAEGLAGGGRGARLWPFRVPGPCLAFAGLSALLSLTTPAAGNGGADVIPSARGQGSRPGGQRPGGAAACRVDRVEMRSPRARTPRREQTGWKRVCEPGDVRSHSLSYTKLRFVATALKREEVVLALSSRVWSANRVLRAWTRREPDDALVFRDVLIEL